MYFKNCFIAQKEKKNDSVDEVSLVQMNESMAFDELMAIKKKGKAVNQEPIASKD